MLVDCDVFLVTKASRPSDVYLHPLLIKAGLCVSDSIGREVQVPVC